MHLDFNIVGDAMTWACLSHSQRLNMYIHDLLYEVARFQCPTNNWLLQYIDYISLTR